MKITYKDTLPKDYKKVNLETPKGESLNLRKVVLAVRKAAMEGKKDKTVKKAGIVLKELPTSSTLGVEQFELGEIIAREALMADYEFTKYLSKPKEGWNALGEFAIVGKVTPEFKRGVERGKIVAGEVNATRELANTPGGDMTPLHLATAARQATRGLPHTTVKVLGVKEMEKLGMGAVLGVGKGSPAEPKFIIVEYMAGPKGERPVVLVGKGVTFDTGGLSLKPSDGMYTMHLDMSGGAAVIHTIALAAKLGIKKNVVALVPAVENMPGGYSYRPGDVLRSMSGKSIEVLNTDAEGRVILADGLFYAGRYNPSLVIDVATLTGAAVVALGLRASGIFSRDEALIEQTRELGEKAGDYVWPMPLWEEYEAEIKGTFGDFANMGKQGRWGGAIAAAAFLLQFTKDYPKDTKWMHIDMAPTMESVNDEFLAKGAKGTPVKLLLSLIENN